MTIATGPSNAVDGYLDLSPDAYGSWASVTFNGSGDNFNPAGAAALMEVAFSSYSYVFIPSAAQRQLISENPGLVALGDDATLDLATNAPLVASDTNSDGVNDTLTSAFRVFGGNTDLSFDLVQRVAAGSAPGVAFVEQLYTVTNDGASAVTFNTTRIFDGDLLYSGDFSNDEVGTTANGGANGVFVVMQEVGDPTTAITLSSPDANIYSGGKNGVTPTGGPPPFNFGTDTEVFDAGGIPASWVNFIAGVGASTNGFSGATPPGSTAPEDAFIMINVPITVDPGQSASFTLLYTYGQAMPNASTADVSITKNNGAASSVPGTNTTYTIVASNAGPTPVIGATVADTFPAACTAVSWSCVAAGGATCTAGPTAGNINDLIDLPVGGTATYTAICSIGAGAVGTLDNTATITEPGGVTDPEQTNNSATDSDTLVASADVSIGKTAAAADPLVIGSTITYTLTASNAGPSDAAAVTVTDPLPANVTYVSNTCGASFAAPTVTWNIATLADGASVSCDIVVTVSGVGPINNTATIASAGDPNGANNSGTASLAGVPASADVAITLTAAPAGGLSVGDTFVYTVTGTNNGPGDATGVLFNLVLSNKVSFVSSNCGAVLNGNVVSWSVPTLANGASTNCQITVAVVLGGDINATATVSTTTVDPVAANNSASVVVGFDPVPVPALDRLGLLLAGLLVLGLGLVTVRRY